MTLEIHVVIILGGFRGIFPLTRVAKVDVYPICVSGKRRKQQAVNKLKGEKLP